MTTTLSRRALFAHSSAAGLALAAAATPAGAKPQPGCTLDTAAPAVLTVSGPSVVPNRGAPDAVQDRMLVLHGHAFTQAWSCALPTLQRLPQHTQAIELEYDAQTHSLRGPTVASVLQASGVDVARAIAEGHWLLLQGIDGYRAQLPVAQVVRWNMLLATEVDGQPLSMGGLGPLWGIYAPQHLPELAALPLKERFVQAVWGLYYLQVSATQPITG